jgi:hypothetical protein
MAIWYNLWPFGIVCGHLLHFSQFGMFGPRKIWQTCCQQEREEEKGFLKFQESPFFLFF